MRTRPHVEVVMIGGRCPISCGLLLVGMTGTAVVNEVVVQREEQGVHRRRDRQRGPLLRNGTCPVHLGVLVAVQFLAFLRSVPGLPGAFP